LRLVEVEDDDREAVVAQSARRSSHDLEVCFSASSKLMRVEASVGFALRVAVVDAETWSP